MPCPYCLHDQIVYVHGHGQCARCGINIEPCCDGVPCSTYVAFDQPQARPSESRNPTEPTDSR